MSTDPNGPFQHEVLLCLLKGLERVYQLVLRAREGVHGESGVVYDNAMKTRYFQMSWEASFEVKDLLTRRAAVVDEVVRYATDEFLEGLKKAGGKPGDYLLILTYPAQPPVVLTTPDENGLLNVWCKLIVSLPQHAPEGLKEDSEAERGSKPKNFIKPT